VFGIHIVIFLGLSMSVPAGLWFASPRTRKLARFTLLIIFALVALVAVAAILRIYVFPLPPF